MKTRPRDYLTRETMLCQLAEEAALKERRTITRDNPTPVSYNTAHAALIEEVADVYCCLGELLNLCDWESVATIRSDKETRWMRRLEEKEKKHETTL